MSRICRRGVWLDRGRVIREGPIAELAPEYHDYLLEVSERKAGTRGLKLEAHELPAP